MIKIVNATQAAFYWLNGCPPLDNYPSRDHKTNKPIMVYVFRRSETKDLFDLWCKQQEEKHKVSCQELNNALNKNGDIIL